MKSYGSVVSQGFPQLIKSLSLPLAVMLLLWTTSINHVSQAQFLVGLTLLVIPWTSYLNWKKYWREELPIFALIAFMYWVYYVPALYWTNIDEVGSIHFSQNRVFSEGSVTNALGLVLLGIVCLWLGMKTSLGRKLKPRKLPHLSVNALRWNYLRMLLVVGIIAETLGFSPYLLGEGGRQIILIFVSTVPLLAFAILFRNYLQGNSSQSDKVLIAGFLLARFVLGLASGWLGSALDIVAVAGSVYVMERCKVPQFAIVLLVLMALFFQVGKEKFRLTYWYGGIQAGTVERVTTWVNLSVDVWQEVLADGSSEKLVQAVNPTVSRLSLLGQSTNVLEQTPSVVPYQYGKLYSYMLVTFIPRAIWPDKPSMSEANQFYQVAYGLTDESNLSRVSIGVGVLTESYISFGWFGAAAIMFLLGIFFDFYQQTFLSKESGSLMIGLGLALLPQFMVIESQMAQYLGGIIQQVLFFLFLLLPVWSLKSVAPSRSGRAPAPAPVSGPISHAH